MKNASTFLKALSLVFLISLIPNISQGAADLYTWGSSGDQLGDPTMLKYQPTPVQPSGLTGVTDISAGWYHSMALAWGSK